MTGLLAELGKKLAERWLTALMLPGLLLVAVAVIGFRLSHRRPFDVAELSRWVDDTAASPVGHSQGALLLITTAVLLAAGAAGLAAAGLGAGCGRWCVAEGTWPPGSWLAAWRRRRWERADRVAREALQAAAADVTKPHPPLRAAILRRDRIALRAPHRPTFVGDRFSAVDQRVADAYGLDLVAVWPRIWLVVDDPARAQASAAQDAYAAALRLAGWGLLYLGLGVMWWPAAVVGLVVLGVAWARVRRTAGLLADLVEATVDLHGRTLADRLGLPVDGRLTRAQGQMVTAMLRKDVPLSLPGT